MKSLITTALALAIMYMITIGKGSIIDTGPDRHMGQNVVVTADPTGVGMGGASRDDASKGGRARDMIETVMCLGLATSIAPHRPGVTL